ncbi:hypothetical protein MHZ92_07725 [Sporosarcina sp. ACRSL]|uniref:hypothetical protein n=1 Tax=Sporosarcina sp. ACRSL TaxID=2918215 RepID=UPI001EF70B7A|nr:hypothetical protein [Sporosarcina sp. ACRSL]MCG7344016.1 hypothetical protein [Sporosarcina sp. ACRSL]
MKSKFEEIVDVRLIGGHNPKKMNELAVLASKERIAPSSEDKEKVLFIGIDVQNDFLENGELAVPNSHIDVENMTRFIYDNLKKITSICVSMDAHDIEQIFHSSWWIDKDGNHPAPFTVITRVDVENGKWRATQQPEESKEYIEQLEKVGKKQLIIWPYHCLAGTFGAALEGQFSNIIHFHSMVRQTEIIKIFKGQDPLSEMYGIVKPEYSKTDMANYEFLESLKGYQKIIIGGEAKSHCVLESVKQIVDYYKTDVELTSNIYLLKDCMSSIQGFEDSTEQEISELQKNYGIQVVDSSELKL